jgi:hypothetical protein
MSKLPEDPVKGSEPTMCSVCAWRADCNKKFSYAQGGVIKCSEFTRDVSCRSDQERHDD